MLHLTVTITNWIPIFLCWQERWKTQTLSRLSVPHHTIKNAYSLPLISELLDKLKGAWWFTKLDVRWGYNNVRIRDGDQWKVAFKMNRGLFEPTVMFFGMCNSHFKQWWTTFSEIWSTTALWSYTWTIFSSLHQTKRHWQKTPRRF